MSNEHAEHTRKLFYHTLSIRGSDFIAHYAYEELIFAHAQPALHTEHMPNEFHHWLSISGNVLKLNISAESNMIFKNLVLQALGTIKFRFLQKNS
jgi:hypothetical protein